MSVDANINNNDGTGLQVSQLLSAAATPYNAVTTPVTGLGDALSLNTIDTNFDPSTASKSPSSFDGKTVNLDHALDDDLMTYWHVYYIDRLTGDKFEAIAITSSNVIFPINDFYNYINDPDNYANVDYRPQNPVTPQVSFPNPFIQFVSGSQTTPAITALKEEVDKYQNVYAANQQILQNLKTEYNNTFNNPGKRSQLAAEISDVIQQNAIFQANILQDLQQINYLNSVTLSPIVRLYNVMSYSRIDSSKVADYRDAKTDKYTVITKIMVIDLG